MHTCYWPGDCHQPIVRATGHLLTCHQPILFCFSGTKHQLAKASTGFWLCCRGMYYIWSLPLSLKLPLGKTLFLKIVLVRFLFCCRCSGKDGATGHSQRRSNVQVDTPQPCLDNCTLAPVSAQTLQLLGSIDKFVWQCFFHVAFMVSTSKFRWSCFLKCGLFYMIM